VLGQALTAASYTVEGREVHSLHAYFLRPGDVDAPIVYEVDRARDGRSFSNRRVVAIQHGRPIFNMAASFQVPEQGNRARGRDSRTCRGPRPHGPARDAGGTARPALSETMRRFLTAERPFEMRPVEPIHVLSPAPTAPRAPHLDPLASSCPIAACTCTAICSPTFPIISSSRTATLPHGIRFEHGNVQMASLDHAMWFHRPFRVDDWLLYSMDSPSASGSRGLALGRFYARDGALVASTAQEGLIRLWPKD
jgi:acyl-CoA thioesterase II